jgi:hypothetical protein
MERARLADWPALGGWMVVPIVISSVPYLHFFINLRVTNNYLKPPLLRADSPLVSKTRSDHPPTKEKKTFIMAE